MSPRSLVRVELTHSPRNSDCRLVSLPTYELICQVCGERFDRFLTRLLREEDRVCPVCGSTQVQSGFGGGILGKGTGAGTPSSSCGTGGFT